MQSAAAHTTRFKKRAVRRRALGSLAHLVFHWCSPFPSWTQAAEGARWMSEKEEELAKVEAKLASLSKRVGVSKGLEFKQMEIDPLVELGYG